MTAEYLIANQPDILEVISNLSNDEVFTPPRVVNAVLDLLPEDVWTNPELRWLDPGCKTGVFPREVTKRLMVGLASTFPDEKQRLEHILKNMVFAIAITEITSLMSRRTLYCSKNAAGEHSVVAMPSTSGNIWFERVEHSFVDGRCQECKGSKEQLEREGRDNYAYGFVHKESLSRIEKEFSMKFDVIIGNPPYQMDADSEGANIVPLYDAFVEQAKKLNPKYIAMIIPSRWMAGGKGLDTFRESMLQDRRFKQLVDYPNANEVFPSVEIKGGVCYFLWDNEHAGDCIAFMKRGEQISGPTLRNLGEHDVFVRDARALPILQKVLKKQENSFADLVSTRDPFGPALSSNFKNYRKGDKKLEGDLKLYMNEGAQRVTKWIDPNLVSRNFGLIDKWKVFVPKAGSDGGQKLPDIVLGNPLIAEPGSVSTMTYLAIGPFNSRKQAESVESYLKTRFFRFLVSLRKVSQNSTTKSYLWVPQQTWDRNWTDEELFKIYGITKEEQAYINEMIKEMS